MNKPFRCGLIVGKFCPLHKGHERLIDTALEQCVHVVVISYTQPAFEYCTAEARERWLRERFPHVQPLVLDDTRFAALAHEHGWPGAATLPHNDADGEVHRRFVAWLCDRVLDLSVDAVFTSEDYGDGFAQVMSTALRHRTDMPDDGVRHICVDRARQAVPISATVIRDNVHAHRAFLSPMVYADFVQRVCFLGGESSGKTTLAQAVATQLDTAWVPEYGRQRWDERDGELAYDDLLHIARTQVEHERQQSRAARRWLLCDTSPLTTLLYCRDLFGRAEPELEALASRPYDHVFLCAPDFPFVQDGTRRDDDFRCRQHAWYVRELTARALPFTVLYGSLDERTRTVTQSLGEPLA